MSVNKDNLMQIDKKRKQLIFRSWHRGTREMDLLLGPFADQYVPDFSEEDLDSYAHLLTYNDPELYRYLTDADSFVDEKCRMVFHALQKDIARRN